MEKARLNSFYCPHYHLVENENECQSLLLVYLRINNILWDPHIHTNHFCCRVELLASYQKTDNHIGPPVSSWIIKPIHEGISLDRFSGSKVGQRFLNSQHFVTLALIGSEQKFLLVNLFAFKHGSLQIVKRNNSHFTENIQQKDVAPVFTLKLNGKLQRFVAVVA